MTREELAWAAGLFEGEGTITIGVRKSDETYRLICTIGNTDKEIVAFFHDRWSGWFQPAYGERPNRKPAWYWTCSGPRAEKFLRDVGPYFITRRAKRKCELGLAFRACQSRSGAKWRTPGYKAAQREIYLEFRQLNARGLRLIKNGEAAK